MTIVASEVRNRFIESGLTVKEFAKASGISTTTAGRILKEDRSVNNKTIAPIAKTLGCKVSDIIQRC